VRSPRRRAPHLDPEHLTVEAVEFLGQLDDALRDLTSGDGAPPGFSPDRYLAPGVPRIRPILVLLSARAAHLPDRSPEEMLEATEHVAVAAEALHLAIVLHDAALGRQGGRRRRAARRLISSAMGVLGGNHMSLRALELARHAPAPEIIGDLLEAMREIGEGRALAQSLGGRCPTVGEAIELADDRSGAVFAFACRAGARLARADNRVITALGRYGRHTGLAWQFAEDLAAVSGALDSESDTPSGELLADHAATHRANLAVCQAVEADPAVGRAWLELTRDPDPERARRLAARIHATGALPRGRQRVVYEVWTARKELSKLTPSRHREVLDRITATLGG